MPHYNDATTNSGPAKIDDGIPAFLRRSGAEPVPGNAAAPALAVMKELDRQLGPPSVP